MYKVVERYKVLVIMNVHYAILTVIITFYSNC